MKIGLEIHIELDTATKLFCSCPRKQGDPNTVTCPVCLGHPGTRPRTNKEAVKQAMQACIALDADINQSLVFAR
jgi:aspartyl-tRNA(Asn)/glutamyl-tRNA(Gln) amidotransferase subunit B